MTPDELKKRTIESGMKPEKQVSALMQAGNELVAIFNASLRTARQRLNKPRTTRQTSNQKSAMLKHRFAV